MMTRYGDEGLVARVRAKAKDVFSPKPAPTQPTSKPDK